MALCIRGLISEMTFVHKEIHMQQLYDVSRHLVDPATVDIFMQSMPIHAVLKIQSLLCIITEE